MNRENRLLITDELVEIQDLQENDQSFQRNLENIPQINNETPKDVNM